MADYFFSPSTSGFYVSGVNISLPDDVIPLDFDHYKLLALSPWPTGAVIVVDEASNLPILSVPPSPWYRWDGEKWAIDKKLIAKQFAAERSEILAVITAERDLREASVFQYRGKAIDCDPRAVQRITAAALAAQAALATGQPFSLDWTCADNSVLTLDAAGVAGMPLALAAFADALHRHARGLKQAVLAVEDMAALAAIDIKAGWPEE